MTAASPAWSIKARNVRPAGSCLWSGWTASSPDSYWRSACAPTTPRRAGTAGHAPTVMLRIQGCRTGRPSHREIRVPALATAKRSMNIGSGTFALPAPEEWTGATLVEIDAPDAITNRSVIGYTPLEAVHVGSRKQPQWISAQTTLRALR